MFTPLAIGKQAQAVTDEAYRGVDPGNWLRRCCLSGAA